MLYSGFYFLNQKERELASPKPAVGIRSRQYVGHSEFSCHVNLSAPCSTVQTIALSKEQPLSIRVIGSGEYDIYQILV